MDLWAHLVKGSGGGASIPIDSEFLLRGLLLSKELKLRDSFEATFREIANISTVQASQIFTILASSLDNLAQLHVEGTIKWKRSE